MGGAGIKEVLSKIHRAYKMGGDVCGLMKRLEPASITMIEHVPVLNIVFSLLYL